MVGGNGRGEALRLLTGEHLRADMLEILFAKLFFSAASVLSVYQ